MFSPYTLWTVAFYEIKTLFRSWFFRIFASIALILILLVDYLFFASGFLPWSLRTLPASIPYLNTFLVNMAQAIIAIFIASDFLKNDRKLNSAETIYSRSMTNAEYVIGKTIGVFALFMGLNLLVLLGAFTVNVFFSDVSVKFVAYVIYPLLISIPTLLYILGLAFFVMATTQNQAVTFILLLAYIAGTLFYFGSRFYYLFDYMAFNLPMLHSDIVGFAGLAPILMHRGMYLLAGIGFILSAVLMLRRLSQSKLVTQLVIIIMTGCFVSVITLGYMNISEIKLGQKLRTDMRELNGSVADLPRATVTDCDIDIVHEGSILNMTANLTVTNKAGQALNTLLFSLNPGYDVTDVSVSGSGSSFERNLHLITVRPATPLEPGASTTVSIAYNGIFDEDACYISIDEEERELVNSYLFYRIAKRFGFQTPEYVLLTPECQWYPISGVPANEVFPQRGSYDFTNYSLDVTTSPVLKVISQGAVTSTGEGSYHTATEAPVHGLTLAIGKYKVMSTKVDDVEYKVAVVEDHDYFSEMFTDVVELIPEFITEIRSQVEADLETIYPYNHFSFVETPVQFYAYSRPWQSRLECVQPQMMLLPEKGFYLDSADFEGTMERNSRYSGGGRGGMMGGGGEMSPEDTKIAILRSFAYSTVMNSMGSMNMRSMSRQMGRQAGFSLARLFTLAMPSYSPTYSMDAYVYDFVTAIESSRFPILNTVTAFQIASGFGGESQMMSRMMGGMGISSDDEACILLDTYGFDEVIENPPEDRDVYSSLLKLKTLELFGYIASETGTDELTDYLREFADAHKFVTLPVDSLFAGLDNTFGIDSEQILDSWYNDTGIPEFIISNVTLTEIVEYERTAYQMTFNATNTRNADGIFHLSASMPMNFSAGGFMIGGGGGRGMGGGGMGGMEPEEIQKFYTLEPYQSKKIGIVFEAQPQMLNFNTIISRNIPLQFNESFGAIEVDESALPFNGEIVLDEPPALYPEGTIVVDNEDPGFAILSQPTENPIRAFLRGNIEKQEYEGFNNYRPPASWTKTINEQFFGNRKAAVYKEGGNGDMKVEWTAEIPESGRYDVFTYTPMTMGMGGRGGNFVVTGGNVVVMGGPGGGGPGGGGRGGGRDWGRRGQDDTYGTMTYYVHHDDGTDPIVIDTSATDDEGWSFIGNFYFSAGPATIELTDETSGRVVIADAIKWVKK